YPETYHLFHGEPKERDEGNVEGYLGGGTYACAAPISRDDETHAAVFELDAPPLNLQTPNDAEVERQEERTVVTSDELDLEGGAVVRRVEEYNEQEARRVIPEQVYRSGYAFLRYSLPFFDEDTDEIAVEGVDTIRLNDGNAVIVYEGQAYEATKLDA
ncbi:MAG: hypothetical protein ACLFSW_07115, partial [Halobacteriales archaeon]